MKGHISNRKLAAYLADTMDDAARGRIGGHIDSCDRCRALLETIQAAVAPRYASLRPGSGVRDRILRTRAELESGERKPGPAGLSRIPGPRLLGAAALGMAAVAAVALIFFLKPAAPTVPALVTEMADPGVTVDGGQAKKGTHVLESSALVLPDKTMARLAYGHGFTMTLIGPCELTIDRLSTRGAPESAVLECTLERGILVSANEGGSLSYAYSTPGARVDPAGTEFLLQASGESTLVVMKSGTVRLRQARSGETAHIRAGDRCTADSEVRVAPASAEDLKMIGDHEGLRAGAFARGLLPVLPLKWKRQGMRPAGDTRKTRERVRQAGGGHERGERGADDLLGDEQGTDLSDKATMKREDARPGGNDRIDNRREMEARKERREKVRARRAMR